MKGQESRVRHVRHVSVKKYETEKGLVRQGADNRARDKMAEEERVTTVRET
jgi:hypothetical protein